MHIYLEKPTLSLCQKCGKEVLPYNICWNCGHYKGKEVIDVLQKLTKKEKKLKEKEIKAKGKEDQNEGERRPMTMEGLSKK